MLITEILYDSRNNEKKKIVFENKKKYMPIHHRDIWYTKLWINIWCEENGKGDFRRPILALKKVGSLYFCVPLTTQWKENNKWYYHIQSIDFWKPSSLLLSQAKVLDSARFISKIGRVSPEEFIIIKQKIATLYGY